jgi:hypothetical protein
MQFFMETARFLWSSFFPWNSTVVSERGPVSFCSAFVCGFVRVGVCTFPDITLTSYSSLLTPHFSLSTSRFSQSTSKLFQLSTHTINSSKMALPGIEGFKNVYDILEAVSSRDKSRLRRAARKIRLVLMCADNSTLSEEDRASLTTILGLMVTDWDEAEVCCL